MLMIIFYSHVIFIKLVHKLFHFVAVLWFFLFCQQNYLCQSVVIILLWNHDYQFQFMIQIQVMNLVYISYKRISCWLIHFSYCLQKILSKKSFFSVILKIWVVHLQILFHNQIHILNLIICLEIICDWELYFDFQSCI